jgi:hypothetical protein
MLRPYLLYPTEKSYRKLCHKQINYIHVFELEKGRSIRIINYLFIPKIILRMLRPYLLYPTEKSYQKLCHKQINYIHVFKLRKGRSIRTINYLFIPKIILRMLRPYVLHRLISFSFYECQ